jgi:hypothetical protein
MGVNKAILSEGLAPLIYEKSPVRLELEECIHFHQDNLRLIWTAEEFEKVFDLFCRAQQKISKLGNLTKSEIMHLLAGEYLPSPSLQSNRWAIELTEGGWIHIHLGNLRVLLSLKDFEILLDMFRQASVSFYQQVKTSIKLSDVAYPAHVGISYLPLLKKYIASGQYINPTEVGRLKYQIKEIIHGQPTLQREMDKPFTFLYNPVPEDLDRRYLFAIYESIKEWGYANGPYYMELINALKLPDGSIRIGSAHRAAALLTLGYDVVDVFLSMAQEDE